MSGRIDPETPGAPAEHPLPEPAEEDRTVSRHIIDPGPDGRSDSAVVAAFAFQAQACEQMGSPLTALLLRGMIADYKAGGTIHAMLADWEKRNPKDAVLSLRMVGGLHYLVLAG